MSLVHCPLCLGLALLSVGRAAALLCLFGLGVRAPGATPARLAGQSATATTAIRARQQLVPS
jgi:hypothetical protein